MNLKYLGIGLIVSGLVLLGSCTMNHAYARDGWDKGARPKVCGNNLEPKELTDCRKWIGNVQQPTSEASCCGEADAFIADEFDTDKDGNFVAIITEEYILGVDEYGDDTAAYSKGTRIVIPKDKINPEGPIKGNNRTGHGIVFIGTNGDVLCYFLPGNLA